MIGIQTSRKNELVDRYIHSSGQNLNLIGKPTELRLGCLPWHFPHQKQNSRQSSHHQQSGHHRVSYLPTSTYIIVHTVYILQVLPAQSHLLEHICTFATMAGSKLKSDSKYDDFDYPTTSPEVKSGHPGHTTPEQDAQVFQLRTQLEQANYTERLDTLCMVRGASSPPCMCLMSRSQLRFLRARKFNVELAKNMSVTHSSAV